MDIGRIFEDAWKLFVKDVGPLIVGALLVALLSVVTIGILAGPLMGGYYLMVSRRIREGRPAEIGDVFSAFDRFGSLFIAVLVIAILVAIGLVFLILPGLMLAAIWLYVPLFIVDQKMSFGEAMAASRELVTKNGFWLHVGVVALLWLLGAIVGSITAVGFLITWPISLTFVTAMYFRARGEGDMVDVATDRQAAATGGTAATPGPPVAPQRQTPPQPPAEGGGAGAKASPPPATPESGAQPSSGASDKSDAASRQMPGAPQGPPPVAPGRAGDAPPAPEAPGGKRS